MSLIKYEPESTPQFEHDCDSCTYLGQFEGYDLYFCQQGTLPTVIARFGNDGHEYLSGMPVAYHPPLSVAKHLAILMGLYEEAQT